jgi:modulator of FtsH protease HflK
LLNWHGSRTSGADQRNVIERRKEASLMPWDAGGGDDKRSHSPKQTAIVDLFKRRRNKFGQMPGGSRLPDSIVYLVATALASIVAYYALTFRVDADELGIVMRFGKVTRLEPPGLHFRMPYPIDEVRRPKVMRQNIIEVGMRTGTGPGVSYVRDESLMLTGDENIVDVNFVVFWRIKDAQQYLFNMQNPEVTVKEVAESAMREVVGQSDIQPILTGARQKTEQAVQTLMQDVLDHYGAGVRVDQVQLLKVDPPTQVIDAFRDVQAAAADKERLRNEAASYASRIIPEARGDAERILQGARGYREQSVAEATGQSARFLKIYEEYKKAPEVTRKRMYLETMERIMSGTDKIIVDTKSGQGVIPYLPLHPLGKRKEDGN